MRLLVSTHDSGGGAALMGLVTRLRARGAAQRAAAPDGGDDLAVATMRVERKLARWTR
jgi:hypothetical protein